MRLLRSDIFSPPSGRWRPPETGDRHPIKGIGKGLFENFFRKNIGINKKTAIFAAKNFGNHTKSHCFATKIHSNILISN
jgi:hypothetical protein